MQIRHTLATHPYISRGPQRGQWGQLPRPDSDTRPKWREAGPACCAKTSFCAAFGCTLLRRASRRDWAVAAEAFFFLPLDQPPTNSSVFLLLGACPAPDCKPVVSAEAAVCVAPWETCRIPLSLQVTEQGQVPDCNQANQRPSLGFFTNWN